MDKRPEKSSFARSAVLFLGIGLLIYALVFLLAERLVYQTGKGNPFFKIATAEKPAYDWVVLGASHAMPLDFTDFNEKMEHDTGQDILNLATPGAGPLYNMFVFEHYLRTHDTRNILYVADSFGFMSQQWNEDRIADSGLLSRTPQELPLAAGLFRYCLEWGVTPLAFLDYVSGFSKLNNPDRFDPDIWEGEAKFDRVFRPSATAERKRVDYLFPDQENASENRERYLEAFSDFVELAERNNIRVLVIKMPVPSRFYARLPEEASFDEALGQQLVEYHVTYHDFSQSMDESRFYFDTDHLNRAGVTQFFEDHLKSLFES